ncbi:MAG: hypothetical protein ACYCSQ_00385 [bacterium]
MLLTHKDEILQEKKEQCKRRDTTHRANGDFGDGERPAPREKIYKWIREINEKEKASAKRTN